MAGIDRPGALGNCPVGGVVLRGLSKSMLAPVLISSKALEESRRIFWALELRQTHALCCLELTKTQLGWAVERFVYSGIGLFFSSGCALRLGLKGM